MEDKGKAALLAGIVSGTGKEVERIQKESAQRIQLKLDNAKKQAQEILAEAEKNAARQEESLKKTEESAIEMFKRRSDLELREKLTSQAISEAYNRFAQMIAEPAYKKTFTGWLAEAALGLTDSGLVANAGKDEQFLLSDEVFTAAAAIVKEKTGRKVAFKKAEDPPLLGQGPSVASSNGKTVFSNTISTRFLRYQSEVRRTVYELLFSKGNK